MEEMIKCPNCLGYGCCVLVISHEDLVLCIGYKSKICGRFEDEKPACICPLCEGTGVVSWIDMLFYEDNSPYSSLTSTFKKLRNNITEIEKLIERI